MGIWVADTLYHHYVCPPPRGLKKYDSCRYREIHGGRTPTIDPR